ncbi:hypothetical protein HK414_10635 [Ramlibacter terrae]|uniref:Uncharacterized protein n=1 Tax=Ramlibacter terrae TaxID=2732511 RepID=A0ABX6P474_9BURK|nr:hypothetical protein HK414_10635 [Ramlibacter terrae]
MPVLLLYQCRRCAARFLHARIDPKNRYGYVYRPTVKVTQAGQARRT